MSAQLPPTIPRSPPAPTDGMNDAELQAILSSRPRDRLSLPWATRVLTTSSLAFACGGVLGLSHGSQMASLRFRAENSHRLPTNQRGWYLYHKTKNYYVMRDAGKEAFRMGGRLGGWVGLFMLTEEAVDRLRWKHEDFLSSTVAGMSTAGAFSVWNRLPMITFVKMTKLGLFCGLGYGLLQDMIRLLQGQRIGYVEFLKGSTRSGETGTNGLLQNGAVP